MTYATLMVHLQIGQLNSGVLKMARHLAESHGANVIGIAAQQPLEMAYGDGIVPQEMYEESRAQTARLLKDVEAGFRSALQGMPEPLEWRSSTPFDLLADYVAGEARSADLILTTVDTNRMLDAARCLNTNDLIMQAGRPVLLVPAATDKVDLDRVMIGWKDTREARRAIVDAIPLLQKATHVSLVEICTHADQAACRIRLADVAAWLQRHGVAAKCIASPSTGDDAEALYALGQDIDIDLIVAGAYGHSRLREWALGGVTSDLLVSPNRCALVSH